MSPRGTLKPMLTGTASSTSLTPAEAQAALLFVRELRYACTVRETLRTVVDPFASGGVGFSLCFAYVNGPSWQRHIEGATRRRRKATRAA